MSDYKLEDYYPPNDEYKCTLDEKYQRIALEELREEPYIREQSIAYLREWISKHPTIKKSRTDSAYLLRFLRTRKYHMPAACENLEAFITSQQIYPQWMYNLDPTEPSVWEIISNGYIIPLPKRDSLGRKIFLVRSKKIDPHKIKLDQVVRALSVTFEMSLDDELSQVTGFVTIYDIDESKMAHMGLCSLNDLRKLVNLFQSAIPMRQKSMIFLNVPSFYSMFFEFGMTLSNEKLRSRVKIHKSTDDISQYIDKNVLPLEYGGTIPADDMLQDYLKQLKEARPRLLALSNMYIDIDTNSPVVKKFVSVENDLNFGVQGSFRKLNLD